MIEHDCERVSGTVPGLTMRMYQESWRIVAVHRR